jgi:hypothetical protein
MHSAYQNVVPILLVAEGNIHRDSALLLLFFGHNQMSLSSLRPFAS